ncbi:tektin-3-like isoform X2 [Arctopsyche grandis]|uniref:tektin-3-like isoform X2 n=1 Tax=Arctopsyche grandis TaxID=121162 RepID=UPI00406D71B2
MLRHRQTTIRRLLCDGRQLQPWNPVRDPIPMTPQTPKKFDGYQTSRQHPWRPEMGYETIESKPLPHHPITNRFIDCNSDGLEATRFPNLVTGFEQAPAHATRAALYTRYTPHEWGQNTVANYNESDSKRNYSERMRNDILRCMRETDEITNHAQRDAGRRIGERITDTTFWRNELSTELERLVSEMEQLNTTRRQVERSLQGCEGPLHVVQECLYHREKRQGIELVHDGVEKSLLQEVEQLRNCQNNFREMLNKINAQLRDCRAAQHELETDIRNKEGALGIDTVCHQMNNTSRGIQFYAGVERYDPTVSVPPTWAEASAANVRRSQSERARSSQMRSDAENLINVSATSIWDHWCTSNNAFSRKNSQSLEMKNKLQLHLHKVQQEIFDVEKTIELLNKAIRDKSAPMKVAHTRLQSRTNRPHLDKCRDEAHNRLVQEVCELQDSISKLREKLAQAESNHQSLLGIRASLEVDLRNKVSTLFIDRDQCGGLRRGYPVTASIQY